MPASWMTLLAIPTCALHLRYLAGHHTHCADPHSTVIPPTANNQTPAHEHAAQMVVTAARSASAVAAPHSVVRHGAAVTDMALELRHSQATSVGAQPTAVAAAEMHPLAQGGIPVGSGHVVCARAAGRARRARMVDWSCMLAMDDGLIIFRLMVCKHLKF